MAPNGPLQPLEADHPGSSSEDISAASARDLDDNYQFFKGPGDLDASDDEAKRVLRKIDLRVVPILFMIYFLQYLDKNSINFANTYGLQQGTNLHGQDYSWLGSIFYFGYLASQLPSAYLMQKLPIGKVVSCTTIVWGIIVMTTPACTSFAGIATNRFLLGFTEATVNPGFVIIMSIWYTSAEQPLRLEAYYCTNGLATMFGGLIGYAVGNITTGLPRWMYVFLIFGSLSFAQGILSFIFLPDVPATARFLNERERTIAIDRVSRNRQGVKNHHFKKDQAIQCLLDPSKDTQNSSRIPASIVSTWFYTGVLFGSRTDLELAETWILFIMATGAQVPNSAITSFASAIIKSFGFDALGTQYMQIPGGAVQFLALIIGGWICTKWPRGTRCPTMIVANLICILGSALLVKLPDSNKWGRLVALWLCYFQGLGFSMSLTMISSNIAGSTKKSLTAAILFTGYCVGNIIGPQTFRESEAPYYHSAYIAMLVGYTVKLVMIIVLYVYMWRVNKARDAMGPTDEKAADITISVLKDHGGSRAKLMTLAVEAYHEHQMVEQAPADQDTVEPELPSNSKSVKQENGQPDGNEDAGLVAPHTPVNESVWRPQKKLSRSVRRRLNKSRQAAESNAQTGDQSPAQRSSKRTADVAFSEGTIEDE
ncbi:Uu.00g119600.m01.CDS01 [Anthostomella pinea]|uniref:Uu.00g119600.m01.CDS01 n=1 Tax=Anthostomella pinea TaxID=933095 RepID=A0AAI8VH58_9PEZI|nr:Uu.00g119600.m01.CDS01 [Anthostomella pinea]